MFHHNQYKKGTPLGINRVTGEAAMGPPRGLNTLGNPSHLIISQYLTYRTLHKVKRKAKNWRRQPHKLVPRTHYTISYIPSSPASPACIDERNPDNFSMLRLNCKKNSANPPVVRSFLSVLNTDGGDKTTHVILDLVLRQHPIPVPIHQGKEQNLQLSHNVSVVHLPYGKHTQTHNTRHASDRAHVFRVNQSIPTYLPAML